MVATLWTCVTVYGFLFDYCVLCCGHSVLTSQYSYALPYVWTMLMDVHSSTSQKLTKVNSCVTWIQPLTGNSIVAVSGNIMIRKERDKKVCCNMIPSHFVMAVYVEACLFSWGTCLFLCHQSKMGWVLFLKTHWQWLWKGYFVMLLCLLHTPPVNKMVTTKRCNKYFCIYCAPLSWAWTLLSFWPTYITHRVCAVLTATFLLCTWNLVYLL